MAQTHVSRLPSRYDSCLSTTWAHYISRGSSTTSCASTSLQTMHEDI